MNRLAVRKSPGRLLTAAIASSVKPERSHHTVSMRSPSMRSKCRTLLVNRVRSCCSAVAPINVSKSSISCPRNYRPALILPNTSQVAVSTPSNVNSSMKLSISTREPAEDSTRLGPTDNSAREIMLIAMPCGAS